jgi:hypothetical protein
MWLRMADQSKYDADWAALKPEQRQELDRLVGQFENALNYQKMTYLAPNSKEGAQVYNELRAAGGLPPELATALSRYRMYKTEEDKQLQLQAQPGFQGPMPQIEVPAGERVVDTPEDVQKRAAAYHQMPSDQRSAYWENEKKLAKNVAEGHFDGLAAKKPIPKFSELPGYELPKATNPKLGAEQPASAEPNVGQQLLDLFSQIIQKK